MSERDRGMLDGPRPAARALLPGPDAVHVHGPAVTEVLRLQQAAGNAAVARMIGVREVAGRAGGPAIQRLSFKRPEWDRVEEGTRVGGVQGEGAVGIVVMADSKKGEPPLAVKPAGTDSPADSNLLAALQTWSGKGRGIGAPAQRLARNDDLAEIMPILWRRTKGWHGDADRKRFTAAVQEEPAYIMGFAPGQTFKAIAKGEKYGRYLLAQSAYMHKLGFMSAIDWFVGYGDRLGPDVANLGNWMSDPDGGRKERVTAIDNYDAGGGGVQIVDKAHQGSWQTDFKPYFDDLLGSARKTVRKLKLEFLWAELGKPPTAADLADLDHDTPHMERDFLAGLEEGRRFIARKMSSRSARKAVEGAKGAEAWGVLVERAQLIGA